MGSRNITVSYDQLKAATGVIQEHATDFHNQFTNLYRAIDTLNQKWQGKDNEAFVAKINEFKGGVAKIEATLLDYIRVMSESARDYKQTQDNVISNTRKLTNRL